MRRAVSGCCCCLVSAIGGGGGAEGLRARGGPSAAREGLRGGGGTIEARRGMLVPSPELLIEAVVASSLTVGKEEGLCMEEEGFRGGGGAEGLRVRGICSGD